MRRLRPVLVLALTALVATLVTAPAVARGGPPGDGEASAEAGPVRDWIIPEEDATDCNGTLRKAPETLAEEVAGAVDSGVETVVGEIAGAAYVGQRPEDWDGSRLLVWAHGYRGEFECNPYLTVDAPPLFDDLVESGTAWIASSYRRNSYDPGVGVLDTKNVTVRARELFGEADHTYVAGVSMGGHVIGAAIEQFPTLYDGALPACGVMGDVELFDYFLDYNLGAAAFADVHFKDDDETTIEVDYPDDDWVESEVETIKDGLSDGGFPSWAYQGTLDAFIDDPDLLSSDLTAEGVGFREFVQVGSGGDRPQPSLFPGVDLYDIAWDYWHLFAESEGDFFFELGEGDGTIANRRGIVGQNSDTNYATEYGPEFAFLDGTIEEVTADNRVRNAQGIKPAPIINGTPTIPVLTMHTLGDLFVPIEMQQIYAREVAANGLSENLVQRAIRDVGHCTFTDDEWQEAYADLFRWVEEPEVTAEVIGGEDLVNDISDPLLGLAWTINDGTAAARGGIRIFGGRPALVP